jgi:undecaprenyl-diphosphatase
VLLLSLLWVAMWLLGGGEGVDRRILVALYAGHRPAIALVAHVLTELGGGWVLTALTVAGAALLFRRGHRRRALVLAAGTALGRLLVELQKVEIGRLRPDANPHLVVVRTLSFPSAHSASSMLVYLSLALLLVDEPGAQRRWAAGALLLSLLIGLSRVLLGVHWPSDVVGGWAFGLLWTMVVLWLSRRPLPA